VVNYTFCFDLAAFRCSLRRSHASDCAQNCAHPAEKRRRELCPQRGERTDWKSRLSYVPRS